jgi:hypothetical protein
MARPAGVEPATFWAVTKHSVQLSYGRIGATNRIRTGNQGVADLCLGRLAMVATLACMFAYRIIIHFINF